MKPGYQSARYIQKFKGRIRSKYYILPLLGKQIS